MMNPFLGLERPSQERKHEDPEIEKSIRVLVDLLEDSQPSSFSPLWIEHASKAVLSALQRRMKKNGLIWDDVIGKLPEKWKERWKYKPKKEFQLPENEYSNPVEVAEAIEHDRLYVFSINNFKFDRSKISPQVVKNEQQNICLKLITLAKKGNISARDTLIGLVLPLVTTEWMERNTKMKKYAHDLDALENRISRSIYLYQPGGASFLQYLYRSLSLEALGMEGQEVSMDASIGKEESGTMHDWIGQESPLDEVEGEGGEGVQYQISTKKRGKVGLAA